MPSSIKIGSAIQQLIMGTHRQTDGMVVAYACLFHNKECRRKDNSKLQHNFYSLMDFDVVVILLFTTVSYRVNVGQGTEYSG